MKTLPLLLTITFIVTACSGAKPKKPAEVLAQDKNISREEVMKNLDKLVRQAKNQGAKAEEFLATDFFLKASSAQSYGDYQTASILYKFLLELRPNETFVKNKYAITLIRTGEIEEAGKVLEQVYSLSKGKEEKVALILAGIYTALNKVDSAKSIYNDILKHHRDSQDACVFLAKAFSGEKSFTKAIAVLDRCEKASKDNKGVFAYYKGKTYLDKGDINGAYSNFARAQKLDPEFTQATLAVGLIHEEKGEAEKAILSYKQYLKENPDDKMILGRLVQVYFTLEKQTEVLPFAEKLAEIEPDNLNLKVKLGIIYSDLKSFAKAKNVFKDVLTYNETSDRILYYLGAISQETQDYKEAMNYFGRVPSSSVLYQDSSLQIAQIMSQEAVEEKSSKGMQKYQEKADLFVNFIENKVKELPTAKLEFSIVKASFFENVQKYAEAIETMEAVMEEKGFDDNHRFYLASLYEKEKRFESTLGLISTMITRNPNNAQALNFLGYTMVERGDDMSKAHEYISKAVKISPKDGFIRDSLGWYYFKVGQIDKALKEIKEAKRLVADDPVITKHLAQIYESMNRYVEAKNYYMEALKNCKYEHEREDIYKSLSNLENLRLPAGQK